jgi:hypothetical protein
MTKSRRDMNIQTVWDHSLIARREAKMHMIDWNTKHYLDGKIEQFWFRHDAPGVIFLMNVESVDQANMELDTLPLVVGASRSTV